MAEAREVPPAALDSYRGMVLGFLAQGWAATDIAGWNTRQVYIALGQFMTAAAVLGIDTCPIEGFDPEAYDRILGLDGGEFTTRVACAVGYRHAEDKYAMLPKVRFPLDEVVEHR